MSQLLAKMTPSSRPTCKHRKILPSAELILTNDHHYLPEANFGTPLTMVAVDYSVYLVTGRELLPPNKVRGSRLQGPDR